MADSFSISLTICLIEQWIKTMDRRELSAILITYLQRPFSKIQKLLL